MVFDSPGCGVAGVDELARKIASIRGRKSIVGVADSIAASAAYWLLSQCSEVCVTNGGMIGSVGVLCAHEDLSEQQKKEGIKTSLISAGPHKTEGHPYGPLDAEARAEMQSKCDHYYGMFVSAVARGRGVSEAKVKASFGGGRMLTAQQAVSVGAADRIATLQQVLTDAAGGGNGKGARAEAAARFEARRARAA
jgi:signal peptide peptidase SppA